MMWPLFRALLCNGGVWTWLLPRELSIGLPSFANPNASWLTIVDDLDPAAAGPGSFGTDALGWWTQRAEVFVVDGARPHPRKYLAPADLFAEGRLTLLVQTPEERREEWHQFFRDVRDPRDPPLGVFDFTDGTLPGTPNCRMRFIHFPRPDALDACWPGAGGWQEHNPQ